MEDGGDFRMVGQNRGDVVIRVPGVNDGRFPRLGCEGQLSLEGAALIGRGE